MHELYLCLVYTRNMLNRKKTIINNSFELFWLSIINNYFNYLIDKIIIFSNITNVDKRYD